MSSLKFKTAEDVISLIHQLKGALGESTTCFDSEIDAAVVYLRKKHNAERVIDTKVVQLYYKCKDRRSDVTTEVAEISQLTREDAELL